MAQYDLLLTQNVAAAGIEFSEKYVNISKGGLLSANASRVPTVLDAPSEVSGKWYLLVPKSTEETGFEWAQYDDEQTIHQQNTDAGTTETTFQLDSDNSGPKLKNNAEKLEVRNAADSAYARFKAAEGEFSKVTVSGGDPVADNDLARKKYVDDEIASMGAAANAMTYKGGIDCSTNPNYPAADAGDTYKVTADGKIGGASGLDVVVGDLLICKADGSPSGDHATVGDDWDRVPVNEGTVYGPASSTDGNFPVWNGGGGNALSNSSYGPSSFAPASHVGANGSGVHGVVDGSNHGFMSTTDKAKLDTVEENANNYSHPAEGGGSIATELSGAEVISQMVVNSKGHVTGSSTRNMTPGDIGAMATWVSAPASKTSTGTQGQIAYDGNFIYVCTATDTWKRSPMATNW